MPLSFRYTARRVGTISLYITVWRTCQWESRDDLPGGTPVRQRRGVEGEAKLCYIPTEGQDHAEPRSEMVIEGFGTLGKDNAWR
jgi:hypothetical protein